MNVAAPPATNAGTWTLTECRGDGAEGQIFTIYPDGVSIGRTRMTTIAVESATVSKRHAEILIVGSQPMVRDLGSTNGTFVNGRRVSECVLSNADLVQFGDRVFRFGQPTVEDYGMTMEGGALPFAAALLQFGDLMEGRGVLPHFQPIVSLPDGQIQGYEMLARSRFDELRSPAAMFDTAARLGQECALSELMREAGVKVAMTSSHCGNLFLNTHPREIGTSRFTDSLALLRGMFPDIQLTIEIHEAAVTDVSMMRSLRAVLTEHRMGLAYDDFGAGQARIDELSEIPPDFLKFDIKLVRGLDQASETRKRMVGALVKLVADLGICPLAEGIETIGEAEICGELGFELAQGYFFGRPKPHES